MSSYKIQRLPLFWIVTTMAILVTGGRVTKFVGADSFGAPVRFGGEIIAMIGIWVAYVGVLRGLRSVRGQVADNVLVGVADSAAICCMLGYSFALAACGLS